MALPLIGTINQRTSDEDRNVASNARADDGRLCA